MRNRKGFIKGALIGALTMLLVIIVGLGTGVYLLLGKDGQVINFETKLKMEIIQNLIQSEFLYEEDIDEELMRENVIKGYVDGLGDPYSVYYN